VLTCTNTFLNAAMDMAFFGKIPTRNLVVFLEFRGLDSS